MTKPTHEQKKELKMTIKSISFDLDDTFWPLMPTIMEAEKILEIGLKIIIQESSTP